MGRARGGEFLVTFYCVCVCVCVCVSLSVMQLFHGTSLSVLRYVHAAVAARSSETEISAEAGFLFVLI